MTLASYREYKDTGALWPTKIPNSWSLTPIKRLASMTYGDALPPNARNESGPVPVYGSNGAFGRHGDANTSAPVVLIGRKGSCGALNWSNVPAFAIDTVYFVDSQHAACNLRWLFWALHTANLSSLSQDTGVPGLSREIAYEIRLPQPPQTEQNAVAAFLDRETGKIDALVEEQRQLIELLKEKRQAVISHAVTKGLNPNVAMKASGVEWLGEVPEHWDIVPVGALFRFVKRQDGDAGQVLSVYRDYGVIPKASREDNINKTPEDLSKYQTVLPGDLVVNKMKAWQGSLGVSNYTGITSPDYAVFEPRHKAVSDYLNLLLRCNLLPTVYRAISNGIRPDQWRIEPDKLRELKVPYPPRNDQEAISHHLVEAVGRWDELRNEAETAILLLQERRSALISAAVTGKIDTRETTQADVEAA
ncbi:MULTISPECIES: restriction endonuclease subunit S [unclassified Mesorhizobium]|uniref:restriction endonuclease subunit S n=1 Tax=unclassified Mesorhizobium TaxID=325217 RepID=UPI000FCC1D40|nr:MULTISPECIES: restriction endonuclease subunit S [unclassified Mesorhizobium]RUU58566.1 restriction endonuclease subunit S [Mesorhizobium sp. M7A.T.Ca.TU.009.01.1.1]RUU88144.1 restriction endonuclease subunit S [Mesorhizobium sp. M7A.T.Ca.TU.009.01.1.2]RUT84330.1 restriction endonuclease subunit S [Mesorhizobium sp. M7A.T.Ca.US.000.02.1.1]RUT93563.1 restriction endonuclease subunit S [Mesorhizobium sp. M7A.T.Ca.US.000.02.2.1]RUU01110.1 restriction endonuclease subunit S [Mesorhizobium sp. M